MNGRLQRINNWPELAAQAHWNVAELAELCGVSVKTLERHFLNTFGLPPKQRMHRLRVEPVATDLKTGATVKLAAIKAGYRLPQHFARDFKKHFGRSPSELRRAPRL